MLSDARRDEDVCWSSSWSRVSSTSSSDKKTAESQLQPRGLKQANKPKSTSSSTTHALIVIAKTTIPVNTGVTSGGGATLLAVVVMVVVAVVVFDAVVVGIGVHDIGIVLRSRVLQEGCAHWVTSEVLSLSEEPSLSCVQPRSTVCSRYSRTIPTDFDTICSVVVDSSFTHRCRHVTTLLFTYGKSRQFW